MRTCSPNGSSNGKATTTMIDPTEHSEGSPLRTTQQKAQARLS